MTTPMTVRKILNGSVYEAAYGRKYIWVQATGWAIWNDKNQLVEVYSTKWAAEAAALAMTDSKGD